MLVQTIKSAYQEHRRKMQKRGPTAVLCADSLAAVAVTSLMLPAPNNSQTTASAIDNNHPEQSNIYDDISSIGTTHSDSRLHQEFRRCKSANVPVTRSALFFNKNNSTMDFDTRQRLIESLAAVNSGNLTPGGGIREKKNGPPPSSRTPSHIHPPPRGAVEDHYFGVAGPPRGLPSTSKPIF